MRRVLRRSAVLLAVAVATPQQALAFIYPNCTSGPLANTTVCDTKASPTDRAAALVKAMNITEKLGNLVKYVTIRGLISALFPGTVLTVAVQ